MRAGFDLDLKREVVFENSCLPESSRLLESSSLLAGLQLLETT